VNKVQIYKETGVWITIEEIIENAELFEKLQLLRPLVQAILGEYKDLFTQHSEYFKEQLAGNNKELIMYQKICKNSAKRSFLACKRILLELDMLKKHVNRYHKERGCKQEIKV